MTSTEGAQGWSELDEGRAPGRTTEVRGTGVSKWSLLLLAVVVLVAVVLAQNTEDVQVDVLWWRFAAPLFAVVLLSALAMTLVWELATLALRHRRRGRRSAG